MSAIQQKLLVYTFFIRQAMTLSLSQKLLVYTFVIRQAMTLSLSHTPSVHTVSAFTHTYTCLCGVTGTVIFLRITGS